MKKKILAFSLPAGLFLALVYMVVNRFITKIPDIVAYPILFISILFLMVGIIYNVNGFKGNKRA